MGDAWLGDDRSGVLLSQARQMQMQLQNSSRLTFVNSACGIPLVTRFT